jgi:hypothetical protein
VGRGRAKAKQAKVARKLKYGSGGGMDLVRLRHELRADAAVRPDPPVPSADEAGDEQTGPALQDGRH